MKMLLWFALILLIASCAESPKILGDSTLTVFEKTRVYFDPNRTVDENNDAVIPLDAGRTLIKKVNVPEYSQFTKATLKVRVLSNGDPWDKIGSVFLLPADSDPSFQTADKNESLLGEGPLAGFELKNDFKPAIELMRFATSFGIGHYSDSLPERRPAYMEEWKQELIWEEDITAFMPALTGESFVGIHIDTWTGQGYLADVWIEFEESPFAGNLAADNQVLPILNTVKYLSTQGRFVGFPEGPLEVQFEVPNTSSSQTLYYFVTGHGGHAGGDEFVQKEQSLSVDGKEIKRFVPWRNDCTAMRQYNPHSGVWTTEVEWRGETLKERVASSDLSRSGWCPADQVERIEIPLLLNAGMHSFSIDIPEAQLLTDSEQNFWLVSAVLVCE